MITLTYKDAYDIKRQKNFDTIDDFMLLLAGCLTVPDYYPVISVTYKGKDTGYQGTFGGLYHYFLNFDWTSLEAK